jgi:hypothetical protein
MQGKPKLSLAPINHSRAETIINSPDHHSILSTINLQDKKKLAPLSTLKPKGS